MKNLRLTALLVVLALLAASCASRSEKLAEIMEKLEAGEIPEDVTVFSLDRAESTVAWEGTKVVGAHDGTVAVKEGELYVYDDVLLAGNIVMDMTQIVVLDLKDPGTNASLRRHLESDDFFSVADYPVSTFEIVRFEAIEGADGERPSYRVFGNLTIKDITHGISFDARISRDGDAIRAYADFDIDRTRWGIRFGSGRFFENLGDNMISDLFNIQFDVVARF